MTATDRITLEDLKGSASRRRRERIIRSAFFVAATLAIGISVAIVLSLLGDTITFLRGIELGDLLADAWQPRSGDYGLATLISGTLVVAVIAMLVATPLGLGAAIYLAEYASPRLRAWLKPIIEILATIPSVVLGFFALTVLSPALVQPLCGNSLPFTLASAGVAVGILVTPLVASISEDAMYAVPANLREASYGLGATKRTTSLRIVVPAAVSGIVASLIVAFSRAIGETMIVVMAAGLTANMTINPFKAVTTVTVQIVTLLVGDQEFDSPKTLAAFALGLLLFVITLGLNIIALKVVRKYKEQYE